MPALTIVATLLYLPGLVADLALTGRVRCY